MHELIEPNIGRTLTPLSIWRMKIFQLGDPTDTSAKCKCSLEHNTYTHVKNQFHKLRLQPCCKSQSSPWVQTLRPSKPKALFSGHAPIRVATAKRVCWLCAKTSVNTWHDGNRAEPSLTNTKWTHTHTNPMACSVLKHDKESCDFIEIGTHWQPLRQVLNQQIIEYHKVDTWKGWIVQPSTTSHCVIPIPGPGHTCI